MKNCKNYPMEGTNSKMEICALDPYWFNWVDVWMAIVTIAILILTYLVIELVQLASKPVRVTTTRYVQNRDLNMEEPTVLTAILVEYCITTSILLLTITIVWLIKQVETLTKNIPWKIEVENKLVQTTPNTYNKMDLKAAYTTIKSRDLLRKKKNT